MTTRAITLASILALVLFIAMGVWAEMDTGHRHRTQLIAVETVNAEVFGHCIRLGGKLVSDDVCVLR